MPRTPIRYPSTSSPHGLLTELGEARLQVGCVLEESEARYAQMAEAVPEMLWVQSFDPPAMLYVSPRYEEIWGHPFGDLVCGAKEWIESVHPEDREGVRSEYERWHSGQGTGRLDVTFRIVRPDGETRWLRSRANLIRGERGKPYRGSGITEDVTAEKHNRKALEIAKAELLASEARFRTFFDSATEAFILLDEQLRVVDVNRQACESMGWSYEELIGVHPRQFAMGLDEPSAEKLSQRARAEEMITYETRHRRKDGTWFPVEIRTGAFKKGAGLFYLWIVRDISEHKQADERKANLAAIVESSDDAIIGKDLDGIITSWNGGAERIFNYAAREVIGQSVTILAPPDRVEETTGILERIRRGERVDHFETIRRRKDGTLLDISLTVSPIFDESGKVIGASKVGRDISERKRAEIALQKKDDALAMARTELARMSRVTALGELTTSITHEVAQPLGGMIASASAGLHWLSAEPPNIAEARAALENIAADGKRAREVIARIRAFTKRQVPLREKLDINQQALEVLALTDRELRVHDVVLRTQLDRTLPGVAGDRVQLQQVLINLIMNAIEAMTGVGDRPRELTIVSGQDGPRAVRIEVRDSGTGLDSKAAERVFEAFYTTKAEGIGIGLSISRSLVEAHGGRLWARPNQPHGAVFAFSLPVSEEAIS